ncbi:MAG: Gfo/Idh/MocA family oxidoreductase [Anaerolineae bacterium]|nr:Gfo/Idh/MocA family oxidoreductase [Anaerolineae bacterium]
MLRVGILGLGMMGRFHASRYAQVPNARLVAIADITPERLKAEDAVPGNIADGIAQADLGAVARYADASQLIAEAGVDVVDICLPTYLHARYAIEALGAGHHVLCEKPMALNVEQADRMIDAANRAGRRLMIAQCIRFWPEYRFLSRCVREGTYGKLLSLNMYRMGGRPIWSWENWFVDPARSGGPLYDLHIHDVDYVNSLLGLPEVVHATARMSEATGTYDVVHALYSYDGGPQVHIHAGWSTVQIPFQAGFDAWFERGFLRFDGKSDPPLQVYDDLEHARARPAEYEKGDAYYNEIAYFVDCVEKNAYPEECPPESARDSLGLVTREIAAIEWKGMRR